jgi:hypothetical protein
VAALTLPPLQPINPTLLLLLLWQTRLQTYFENHGIPASVVLKLLAFFSASPADQARVLACGSPDPAAFADAAVVRQAGLFAGQLLQHPPVPDCAQLVESACKQQQQQGLEGQEEGLVANQQQQDAGGTAEKPGNTQQQQQQLSPHDLLVKLWLVWVTNGHSFRMGSALFHYGSKLTHTCAAPNTGEALFCSFAVMTVACYPELFEGISTV